MKSLGITTILVLSILLLTGCSSYRYRVEGNMCESDLTKILGPMTVSFLTDKKPVLIDHGIEKSYMGQTMIVDGICDFSYTRSEIITK